MTHAPGRGRNDPTLITMNNLTRDLRLAETERDRIKAVNAELLAALESAHSALTFWAKMGVNIDCSPWNALTKVDAVIKKAMMEQGE